MLRSFSSIWPPSSGCSVEAQCSSYSRQAKLLLLQSCWTLLILGFACSAGFIWPLSTLFTDGGCWGSSRWYESILYTFHLLNLLGRLLAGLASTHPPPHLPLMAQYLAVHILSCLVFAIFALLPSTNAPPLPALLLLFLVFGLSWGETFQWIICFRS